MVTALLKCNSHNTIYSLQVYNSLVFNILTKLCNRHHNCRIFLSLQKEIPSSLAITPRVLSNLYFFSLQICLLWRYYINGILQYTVFGFFLSLYLFSLSLSNVDLQSFMRSSVSVVCSYLLLISIPLYGFTTFVHRLNF